MAPSGSFARGLFWHDFPMGWQGRARQLCPGNSDVDLLGDGKRVVDLHPKVPHRALDLGVPEEELNRRRFPVRR